MLQVIIDRRSIRKYKKEQVPKQMLEEILKAGMLAPSSKNRQPWKFIVVTGDSKDRMIKVMQEGLKREQRQPLLLQSAKYLSGAEHTWDIMRQAPAVIFIINTLGKDIHQSLTIEERISEICNGQSIGAAIENMSLTAVELGLGSLWICDIYFAYQELSRWLHTDGQLFAALAVGYAGEVPLARPRKAPDDVIEWRD